LVEERRTIGWEDGRPIFLFSTDSPLRSTTGDLADMALYAGMGVGRLTKMTTAGRRLSRLVEDAEALLQPLAAGTATTLASPVCFAGINPDYMGYLDHDALLVALADLRRDAAAALQTARRGSALQQHYVHWLIALRQLVIELAGSDPGPGGGAPIAGAEPGTRLVASTRALMPKIFEERVRQVLETLLSAYAALPPAPAADDAPTPPETPRASAR
jgi:nitronate monooxygenase